MVKSVKYLLLPLFLPGFLWAQQRRELGLDQAYDLAIKNYPVSKQKNLVRQTADINIENLQKGFLPQVSVSAQATYQSDVTKIDVSFPGFSFEPLSKDQYRFITDISQLIYDGGVTKQQKELQQLNALVEDQKIDIELYKLKERISQIYLSILYLDEQAKQIDLLKSDINAGIKRVEAQVQNGVAFKSGLNMLKAELLTTDQRAIEIRSSRKGLVEALELFLGQPLYENVQLQKPVLTSFSPVAEIRRPELRLYNGQTKLADQQDKLIDSKNLPRASLFAQGGYGRPGLNQLKNGFDFYYTGGVRFNWSLGGLYTKKKEKELVEVNKQIVDIQKETFLLRTNTELKQQQSEIDKLQQLIGADKEIIRLRESVKETAKAQLENGVITATDYVREVNAEDQAKQMQITHQLQLLQAQINYQIISGK